MNKKENEFRLKQFSVLQESDGPNIKLEQLIFSALLNKSSKRAMNLGARTGFSAMVLSQDSSALISAYEPRAQLNELCRKNLNRSCHSEKIKLIDEITPSMGKTYDLVFADPPILFSGMKDETSTEPSHWAPSHILKIADLLLIEEGKISLLMMHNRFSEFKKATETSVFFISKITHIKARASKKAKYIIVDLLRQKSDIKEIDVEIYHANSTRYSDETINIVEAYLLHF